MGTSSDSHKQLVAGEQVLALTKAIAAVVDQLGAGSVYTAEELARYREHTLHTPGRVSRMYVESFWGLQVDPAIMLSTTFSADDYNQMIVVGKVEFTSWCAHHWLPFFGRYSFAYIPKHKVVGLSKIPRMIKVLCARPQIQEALSRDIVSVFDSAVDPVGCGVVMDAVHSCMCSRGVQTLATTRTVALSGCFEETSAKSELLTAVGPIPEYR